MSFTIELDLPEDHRRLQLPQAVDDRLQFLLDRQDRGDSLTSQERAEAKGLVELAETLTLLRLRAERKFSGDSAS
jgi:hypothetical protein